MKNMTFLAFLCIILSSQAVAKAKNGNVSVNVERNKVMDLRIGGAAAEEMFSTVAGQPNKPSVTPAFPMFITKEYGDLRCTKKIDSNKNGEEATFSCSVKINDEGQCLSVPEPPNRGSNTRKPLVPDPHGPQ